MNTSHTLFAEHALRDTAIVFFESPNRLATTLSDLASVTGGDRRACVARELTKLHEEIVRGSLDELRARFAEGARGERGRPHGRTTCGA